MTTLTGGNQDHNLSIPGVGLNRSQILYRAYYDAKRNIVTYGVTSSYDRGKGYRRGSGVSTLETYDFGTKKRTVLFPKRRIKAAWRIDDQGRYLWWSSTRYNRETRQTTWLEYRNGKRTGRKFNNGNTLWPRVDKQGHVYAAIVYKRQVKSGRRVF